eukprot:6186398-Pleurochrysis_carterae.AAC.3
MLPRQIRIRRAPCISMAMEGGAGAGAAAGTGIASGEESSGSEMVYVAMSGDVSLMPRGNALQLPYGAL